MSPECLAWAQGLPDARWGEAGVAREARRLAQRAGQLDARDAWALAWSALAHEPLDALLAQGLTAVLWAVPPEGSDAVGQSLRGWPHANMERAQQLQANWLAIAQSPTPAWEQAVGSADGRVVGAYLSAMGSDYSNQFGLGELPVLDWEATVLGILERVPTPLLLQQSGILEHMRHAHAIPALQQLDRWDDAMTRHREGFEQWVTRDLTRKGRLQAKQIPRSWLWLLDRVFGAAPELVDRPGCGFAVVLGSLLAHQIHSQADGRLKPMPALARLRTNLASIPALGEWAGQASQAVAAWVEAQHPQLLPKLRARQLERVLPAPAPGVKPRF